MSYAIRRLKSLAELQQYATAWNDLWQRSAVTIPTAQAELLAQWLTHFNGARHFEAIVVEDAGRFVAALPLVTSRGAVTTGTMPSNHWTPASDLLVDPLADGVVFDLLAREFAHCPWSFLWLDFAIVDAKRWGNLLHACERQSFAVDVRPHFRLPRVDIVGTWEDYRASWSRNHRQQLARARRRLIADHGELVLREYPLDDDTLVAEAVAQGFAIENRCWKGAAGSSVLRTPGMLGYFTRQAQLLAQRGQLTMSRLEAGRTTIAFMYGWKAKEVFHAFKAGYDEAFAAFSPGQLLIHDILEQCFTERRYRVFDCIGPVTPATARWQTSDYEAGRIVIAPPWLIGQAAYFAYKHLAPTLRRWRSAIKTADARSLVQDRQDVALAED